MALPTWMRRGAQVMICPEADILWTNIVALHSVSANSEAFGFFVLRQMSEVKA